MIDTVISDLGQVLLHFDNRLFFERMTRYTSRSIEEIRAVTHENMELLDLFDTGRITPEEFYERAVEALGLASASGIFSSPTTMSFPINPTLAVAERLKPKYKLALLSNTDVAVRLHRADVSPAPHFRCHCPFVRLGRMKPDPAIYREALRRAGTAAERALFIDDLAENVDAAAKLGITGILYTSPEALETDLRRLGLL